MRWPAPCPGGTVPVITIHGLVDTNATVKLVRMDGVAHAYPTGTPLHAAKAVWSFLKAHSRQ